MSTQLMALCVSVGAAFLVIGLDTVLKWKASRP